MCRLLEISGERMNTATLRAETEVQRKNSEGKKRKRNFPPKAPGGIPILGHALDFRNDPVAFIRKNNEQLGEIWRMNMLGKRLHVMSGPVSAEHYFNQPDDVLNGRKIYKLTTPIFGKGIAYDAEPEIFSEQLQFLMPALTPVRLRTYAELIARETVDFCEKWGDAVELDVSEMTHELTTYTSSRTLLGREFRENLTVEFAQLFATMEKALTPLAYFIPNAPIPRHIARDRARKRMVEIVTDIVETRKKNGTAEKDFLQALIDARYSNGRSLTHDEITGILLTIVFAGHHTSATLAAWSAIELAQNPRFVPPLIDEIKEIYGKGAKISMDTLKLQRKMHYMVMEGERMHPPIVLMLRNVLKDMEYKNYTISQGDLMAVCPGASHRNASVYPDPDTWDPERHAPGRDEGREYRYALHGFGGGKHRCLGFHFAYMQIKTIFSVLLSRYAMEPVNPPYVPNVRAMVVGPRHPCIVRFTKRSRILADFI